VSLLFILCAVVGVLSWTTELTYFLKGACFLFVCDVPLVHYIPIHLFYMRKRSSGQSNQHGMYTGKDLKQAFGQRYGSMLYVFLSVSIDILTLTLRIFAWHINDTYIDCTNVREPPTLRKIDSRLARAADGDLDALGLEGVLLTLRAVGARPA
jgi:hypothetical protein